MLVTCPFRKREPRADKFRGTLPLTVNFKNASTGTYSGQLWDFGDGTTSSEQNPSHTYSAEGTYTVSLQVYAPDRTASQQNTAMIYVSAPSVPATAIIKADKTKGFGSLTVNFTNASTGTFHGQFWDFGDGTGSAEANPTHKFGVEDYKVQLWVYLPDGTMSKPDSIVISVDILVR